MRTLLPGLTVLPDLPVCVDIPSVLVSILGYPSPLRNTKAPTLLDEMAMLKKLFKDTYYNNATTPWLSLLLLASL
jgi:hypothetical protein